MSHLRTFVPFALLAISYFSYPGSTGVAPYFAITALLSNLVALLCVMRFGFDICIVNPWYHRVNLCTNVLNILWICSIQYTEHIVTNGVLALLVPFGIAALFTVTVHRFVTRAVLRP